MAGCRPVAGRVWVCLSLCAHGRGRAACGFSSTCQPWGWGVRSQPPKGTLPLDRRTCDNKRGSLNRVLCFTTLGGRNSGRNHKSGRNSTNSVAHKRVHNQKRSEISKRAPEKFRHGSSELSSGKCARLCCARCAVDSCCPCLLLCAKVSACSLFRLRVFLFVSFFSC